MSHRRTAVASLRQELENIEVFDRVHQLATSVDSADNDAYARRQVRRSQIMAEIQELNARRPAYANFGWIGSTVAFLCAVGYATLRYLLK